MTVGIIKKSKSFGARLFDIKKFQGESIDYRKLSGNFTGIIMEKRLTIGGFQKEYREFQEYFKIANVFPGIVQKSGSFRARLG